MFEGRVAQYAQHQYRKRSNDFPFPCLVLFCIAGNYWDMYVRM